QNRSKNHHETRPGVGKVICTGPRHVPGPCPIPRRGQSMVSSGRRHLRLLPLLGFVALVGANAGRSGDPAPATKIEPFTLPDAAGKPWTLPDAKQAPLVAVVFTGTLCPINNAFMPVLAKLHDEYKGKGVTFVAVNANVSDSAEEIAEHAKKHQLPFPVLKDDKQVVAGRFGAKHTPEAFLLDAGRTVRYRG